LTFTFPQRGILLSHFLHLLPMIATAPRVALENTEIAFAYKSDQELKKAEWLFSLINNNWMMKAGTIFTPLAFKMGLPVKGLVRATMFDQFCGGEKLDDCASVIQKLQGFNVHTILDYGVEAKESETEFEKATMQFIRGIQFAKESRHVPFISVKVTGLARFALLEKLNARMSLNEKEKKEWEAVRARLERICKAAGDAAVAVMIDAEETWIQEPVDFLTMEMMAQYNKEKPVVYNTIQLYRHDRLAYMKSIFEMTRKDGFIYALKLVRGAYMEKERKRARQLRYSSPIQRDKESCDREYNAAIEFCIENINHISFCVASHNEFSNLCAVRFADKKGLPVNHPHLHFSQLFGMSDHVTFNFAHAGYNVTKYIPYGPVQDVVPYLMRRAQENTSVGGMSSRELMMIRKELQRRKI